MRSVSSLAVVTTLGVALAVCGCKKEPATAPPTAGPAIKTDCDRALDNVSRIIDTDPAIPEEARAIMQKDLSTEAGRKKAVAGCEMEMPKSVMCMIAAKDMAGLAVCAGHAQPPQGEEPSKDGKAAEAPAVEGAVEER
jgi:hypothetical protein